MKINQFFPVFKDTFSSWNRDNATLLAAGLSYYTVFSLAPLLILAIATAGLVFGQEAAEGTILQQLKGIVGDQVALSVQTLLKSARKSGLQTATVWSVVLLLIGASNVFNQLQVALNLIWGVRPQSAISGIKTQAKEFLKKKIISFSMVFAIGLLLILFFLLDATLTVMKNFMGNILPFLGDVRVWKITSFLVSFVLLTLLTGMIYKFLPDTRIAWSDVWIGAAVTSLLIALGRNLIVLYFSVNNVKSVFGVAGSIVVVFVGIYLTASIFLLGAEFTWIYTNKFGSRSAEKLVRQMKSIEGQEHPKVPIQVKS